MFALTVYTVSISQHGEPMRELGHAVTALALCRVKGGCRYLKPPSGGRLHEVTNRSSFPTCEGFISDKTWMDGWRWRWHVLVMHFY